MQKSSNIVLNDGNFLPKIGLGATGIWGKREEKSVQELMDRQYQMYCYAFDVGKCHLFDTSGAYGHNEEMLGNALHDMRVCRENIVLMSKISNTQQREGDVRGALERSLKNLQVEYLDFYLIHWPQTGTFIPTYLEMEKLQED